MFSVDQYIIDFVSNNWLSITLFLAILREIALSTPSVVDDKIVTLIGNWFGGIKKSKSS